MTYIRFVACLALAGIILLVYGSLVVRALTLRFPNNLQVTGEHFQYVLSGTNGDALRNTLVFSGVAAAVSAIFALFAGWLVQRGQWPGRRALDPATVAERVDAPVEEGIWWLTRPVPALSRRLPRSPPPRIVWRRPSASASRWILVASPPRERPRASSAPPFWPRPFRWRPAGGP